MNEVYLDKLGDYFVHFKIGERYSITFEQFVQRVRSGRWEAYLAA